MPRDGEEFVSEDMWEVSFFLVADDYDQQLNSRQIAKNIPLLFLKFAFSIYIVDGRYGGKSLFALEVFNSELRRKCTQ